MHNLTLMLEFLAMFNFQKEFLFCVMKAVINDRYNLDKGLI